MVKTLLKGCLCSSTLGPRPLSLVPGPQNIARLNTILLFNFEVVITLKLENKYFFLFVLVIKDVESKKLQNNLKS